ncbi:MAG: hypothetical protein V2I33_04275, partial [Kangiellaceae bacterium]|nr:hypothetical protein [Kangiellaceae bacterium]
YDRFFEFPIGVHTRTVLLQYIAKNLAAALAIEPAQQDIRTSLGMIKEKLNDPSTPADSQRIRRTIDPQEMVLQVGRLKKLMRYVHKIGKIPGIDMAAASKSLAHLKKQFFLLQANIFISVATKRIKEGNNLQAKQYLNNAKRMLLQQNIADSETQSLLGELDELENQIKQQQANPEQQLTSENEDNKEDDDTRDLGDSDDLFMPKKKW